jgi:hypothetical protein
MGLKIPFLFATTTTLLIIKRLKMRMRIPKEKEKEQKTKVIHKLSTSYPQVIHKQKRMINTQ